MSFLHPWALALGTLALGLPILVHWLTRPRPVRLPLSTLRFVREAVHQRRAIHRLRDWIIMALRVLAVLLIGWAFSRPLLGDRSLTSADDSTQASRVVLLDVSQSMAAGARGVQAFERARSVAAEHLAHRTGLRANLIFAGSEPRSAFERYSTNFAAMRQELAGAVCQPERCDIQAALVMAAELLAQAPGDEGRRRELVVVSDMQRTNWASADFSVLPADTVTRLESVAPQDTMPNIALVRVGSQGRAELGQPIRLEVEVGNYSTAPRQVEVEVAVGDATYRLTGLCPAGSTATLSEEIAPRQAGWLAGEVRLLGVEDSLAADNARSFVLEVRDRPTYGLITRESADRRPSSSYYLERAIAPYRPRDDRPMERVVRIPPTQVTRETLASIDLIALDRPGKLDPEAINLLAALLRRGRAILYVAAEPIDATNLKLLADAAGSDLQMPIEFVPPAARRTAHDLFLIDVRPKRVPFNVFGESVSAIINPLRFTRALDSRRLETGLVDDVLATYNDRNVCLVSTACGAGSLAVLNADLASSNLPRSPAFVPIIGELAGHLLGQRQTPSAAACGEAMATYLPAEVGATAHLSLRGPEAAGSNLGELVEETGGILWRWNKAGPPGVYQVLRDGQSVWAMATAAPAEESDLRPIAPSLLTERLAGGRTVHYHAAAGEEEGQDDVWTWLAVGCVACMLVELLALKAFRT